MPKTSDTSRSRLSSSGRVALSKTGIESYTSSLKRMSQNEITSAIKPTHLPPDNLVKSIDEGNKRGKPTPKQEADLKTKVRKVFTSPNKPKEPAPNTVNLNDEESEVHTNEAFSKQPYTQSHQSSLL